MFRLNAEEWASISSQFVMTSRAKRPKTALPFVFTEHGALMLASVLRSDVAVEGTFLLRDVFSSTQNHLIYFDLFC